MVPRKEKYIGFRNNDLFLSVILMWAFVNQKRRIQEMTSQKLVWYVVCYVISKILLSKFLRCQGLEVYFTLTIQLNSLTSFLRMCIVIRRSLPLYYLLYGFFFIPVAKLNFKVWNWNLFINKNYTPTPKNEVFIYLLKIR